jgi:dTDP-4-dehydrorhamnose 3,5-epimerase-like enzyme
MNDFKNKTLSDVRWINLPVVRDKRGNLAFLQWKDMPFTFKRVYYLYDIPSGARRGGHAHLQQNELLIAVSGSFDVIIDDGRQRKTFHLNSPEKALLIPEGIWREIENFSANSICLVLNSEEFSEKDYIRDYEEFVKKK